MTAEHVDVLIVGAGLSGIGAACHLVRECPDRTYAILEARDVIGGTWDLFRYPGVRSDSDMFTLGYSFRPWPGGQTLADGGSILAYVRDTAREFGVAEKVRHGQRAVRAEWSAADARWTVTTAQGTTMTCDFLFSCTGYYRYDEGYTPTFAGTADFAGRIVHPQRWPADLDPAGQRVVVIGSGATAVTLVPALAATAAHVTMLQRSPSWIMSLPSRDAIGDALRRRLGERRAAPLIRWKNVLSMMLVYQLSRRVPRLLGRLLKGGVRKQLPAGYPVDPDFSPRYDPWDQRLCFVPDGDLFRAVAAGRATVVTDEVDTFTKEGVRLRSGTELPADVVVTATGLTLLALGGMTLVVDGRPVELADTVAYKGAMLSGVPNLALALGYTNASWTLKCDLISAYVCRLLNHMAATGAAVVTPQAPPPGPLSPIIDLDSGYVLRGVDRLPKQGPVAPLEGPPELPQRRPAVPLRPGDRRRRVQRPPRAGGLTPTRRRPPGGAVAMKDLELAGGVAVVTGAASGIGAALATVLAARGCRLVLLDRDADRLAAVAGPLGAATYVVDLADAAATVAVGEAVRAAYPRVRLLVNNAGIALGGRFEQVTLAEYEQVIDVNFRAVVRLTHTLLPALRAEPGSHLVLVSSLFGLVAPAGQTAYAASKFAVRGFGEALRPELAGAVGVTTVHPGGVRTRIAESAGVGSGASTEEYERERVVWGRLLRFPPERAAELIVAAAERRKPRLLIGLDARVPDLLARLAPAQAPRVFAALQTAARRTAARRR